MAERTTPLCCAPAMNGDSAASTPRPERARSSTKGQILIAGGTFVMGDHHADGYDADGELPLHEVELSGFHMDLTTVTNAAFATFVKQTAYVTDAERFGSSAVFHLAYAGDGTDILQRVPGAEWWLSVRDASWRNPGGNGTDAARLSNHPVVHVSWNDAHAYCAWAGKRLPSEAEWEYAARGGLSAQRFPWGNDLTPRGRWQNNIWQGRFPQHNNADDGHLTTAPVKTYRPNGYGLWQTSGNVWEWCADYFSAHYYQDSPTLDPEGPASGQTRVMRGGSYLCHDSYCNRYRVAARSSNTPDSSAGNVGFRCCNDIAT